MILYNVTNFEDIDEWHTSRSAAILSADFHKHTRVEVIKVTIKGRMNRAMACKMLMGHAYAASQERILILEPVVTEH